MAESVLHVENVTMQFGGVVAVNNLSMDIYEGEIVALIGPNGAGKTTAFNCITGVYEPTNGKVEFCGKTIVENHPQGKMKKLYAGDSKELYPHVVSHTPDYITKMGIARTFQNIRLFKSMTVFDNVLTAMHLRKTSNVFSATFRLNRKEEAAQPVIDMINALTNSSSANDIEAARDAYNAITDSNIFNISTQALKEANVKLLKLEEGQASTGAANQKAVDEFTAAVNALLTAKGNNSTIDTDDDVVDPEYVNLTGIAAAKYASLNDAQKALITKGSAAETAVKNLQRTLDLLEDDDDVQAVYHNWDE